jgi:hypothetical protein
MENKTSTNHENGNDANRLLSAGFSYKFVGYFRDEKYNQFKREVILAEPIFGLAYIKLMNLVAIDENINCVLNSIEFHRSSGEIVFKDKIDYIFSDLCQMLR